MMDFSLHKPDIFCFFSLLSERGQDPFMVEDHGSDTSGNEPLAKSRERSISAPDVYRSRIISGHAPLVSTHCA